MKKAKPAQRSSSTKRRSVPTSVDAYLARVPEPALSTLNKVRSAIRSAVPAETTEIISYGIPAFKHKRVLVWYAAFSDHCSLFPTAAIVEAFKKDLKGYSISKGTIHFPTHKPLPSALLKKMMKVRLADVAGKQHR